MKDGFQTLHNSTTLTIRLFQSKVLDIGLNTKAAENDSPLLTLQGEYCAGHEPKKTLVLNRSDQSSDPV